MDIDIIDQYRKYRKRKSFLGNGKTMGSSLDMLSIVLWDSNVPMSHLELQTRILKFKRLWTGKKIKC